MATETIITTALQNITPVEKDWSGGWYVRAMERLVDVAQDLSHARSLDAIMSIVRIAARELTGADGATFVLRDGDCCYYAEENAISPLWKGKRFPMSICISGWVMNHAQPVLISDIYKDSRIPHDAYRPTFVKSLAMVPIRTEQPVGAIGNYWARNRTPSDKEVSILQALANITALSIENANLYGQLQGKIQDLERSNDELERYAWVASHDLKSPLRAVDNLASWIAEDIEDSGPESAKINLGKLRQRTHRMERMLDDLLEYSMIAENPMTVESSRITGRMMAREIEGLIFIPDGFELKTTPAFDHVDIQRLPLQRVFMNLITNAIKHHDKKSGLITLDAVQEDGQITFTVADNGPGIPAEFRERVFEMFQTLKPRDKTEGSGMGLAVVKKIVAAHGGSIQIEDAKPRGAVFRLTWPTTYPEVPAA